MMHAPTLPAPMATRDRAPALPALRRPIIGVTTQTLHAIEGIPAGLPESWVMNQRYIRAVVDLGAVPVLLPLLHEDLDTLRATYERLDGLLIPGGVANGDFLRADE